MNNDALINNQKVILSEEEASRAASFHLNRYPFAWVKGTLTFNNTPNDDRDHQHWLCEDFGLTVNEFENTLRGYMLPDRIQLFIGSDFRPLNTSLISMSDFSNLLKTHGNRYNTKKVTVYNGVKIGKIGEVWSPLETMGVFNTL